MSFDFTCKICDGTEHWENREMHCDATGMYEKEIESADLIFVADSERTCLRDEHVLTNFSK